MTEPTIASMSNNICNNNEDCNPGLTEPQYLSSCISKDQSEAKCDFNTKIKCKTQDDCNNSDTGVTGLVCYIPQESFITKSLNLISFKLFRDKTKETCIVPKKKL